MSNWFAPCKSTSPAGDGIAADLAAEERAAIRREVKHTRLADFKRDTDGRNVLLKGRWGVRGTISMHVSTTGSGKSILQTQAALCFNRGIPCCGLEPTQPFKVWVIQSEDDDDRVAMDRDEIVSYLQSKHPDQDWAAAKNETEFLDFTGLTGVPFIETLNGELERAKENGCLPDGIIINPLNKFFGGDLMSQRDCSAFLAGGELGRRDTEGIEAVLKRHNIWCWIFAHTGKPPTAKELEGWLNDPYSCYKSCGSSAIPDAVRSIVTFLAVPNSGGVFAFTAGKNGSGLRWTDPEGNATTRNYFRWGDDGRHYWQEVDGADWGALGKATEKKGKPKPPPRDLTPVVVATFEQYRMPVNKGVAVKAIANNIAADRARANPPEKPECGRNEATTLLEDAIGRGLIECIDYGGTKGKLCALPEVFDAWRKKRETPEEEGTV